jgi:hypothetical protein
MSREDAPTSTVNRPGSTTRWWGAVDQYARSRQPSVKVTPPDRADARLPWDQQRL